MTGDVGAALVGTGRWGARIAAAVARVDGLRLVTCFSRDAERRAAFAARFGCTAAATLEEAVTHPEVRAALLVTPNDEHAEQALLCARHGRHVFVEKPIADTLADAERIRDTCDTAGVTLMVGHAFRRLGAARAVRELVASGALGRVVLAEATLSLPGSFPPEAWRAHRARNPGGPLMQLGIHHVDTLSAWLGPPVASWGRFAHLEAAAGVDDVGVVVVEHASGALSSVTGSYVSPKTFAIRLSGTDAVLEYTVDFSVWPEAERLDGASTVTVAGERVDFEEHDMLADELAELARCVRGEAAPETGAEEGIAALRAVREGLESTWARA